MINQEVFLQQMALLADRIGRTLAGPTQREYHRVLSASLTTEQFVAATTLAFQQWSGEFKTWPSPQQLIALITPVATPALAAAEAFERVLSIATRSSESTATRRERIQLLGASAVRAYHAAGGMREFDGLLEVDVPWVRKRFVDAYAAACETADAERAATLALGEADARVAVMVASLANQKALPTPQRRIG